MRESVATLPLAGGRLGLSPLPGRDGDFEADIQAFLAWRPSIVASLTEWTEMAAATAGATPDRLAAAGVAWAHLPIRDYCALAPTDPRWPPLGARLHAILDDGGGVLLHCHGGRGRSGMIALRIMVERGEDPAAALSRLRAVRAGAVETEAQRLWAVSGGPRRGPTEADPALTRS